jgi:glycosyltransferase involved in cell wall biosynthesis
VEAALRRLLGDAELRRNLGQAGRQSVVQYYNWNRVAGDLDRIGQELGAGAAREAAS